MARPIRPTGSIPFQVRLGEAEYTQLNEHLFSDHLDRVPYGAYKAFVEERIREFFGTREMDLAPYSREGIPSGLLTIRGTAEALAALKRMLEERS